MNKVYKLNITEDQRKYLMALLDLTLRTHGIAELENVVDIRNVLITAKSEEV